MYKFMYCLYVIQVPFLYSLILQETEKLLFICAEKIFISFTNS